MKKVNWLSKYLTFTPTAEAKLEEIALWTIGNSVPNQADTYVTSLLQRCDALLLGDAMYRLPASFSQDFPDTPVLLARAGSHFIGFAEIGDEYVVMDFLHARRDLPGKLNRLYAQVEHS